MGGFKAARFLYYVKTASGIDPEAVRKRGPY